MTNLKAKINTIAGEAEIFGCAKPQIPISKYGSLEDAFLWTCLRFDTAMSKTISSWTPKQIEKHCGRIFIFLVCFEAFFVARYVPHGLPNGSTVISGPFETRLLKDEEFFSRVTSVFLEAVQKYYGNLAAFFYDCYEALRTKGFVKSPLLTGKFYRCTKDLEGKIGSEDQIFDVLQSNLEEFPVLWHHLKDVYGKYRVSHPQINQNDDELDEVVFFKRPL